VRRVPGAEPAMHLCLVVVADTVGQDSDNPKKRALLDFGGHT